MKRATGLKGLVLTLNNANVSITDAEAKKVIDTFLWALNKQGKRKDWSYMVWVFFSRTEASPEEQVKQFKKCKPTAVRPHFHVILFANPCKTVADWINDYFNPKQASKRKRLGMVKRQNISNVAGLIDYGNRQSVFSMSRKNIGTEDLKKLDISSYEKAEKTL